MADELTQRFLRGIPLFGDLTDRELKQLAETAYPVGFQAGDYVLRQGVAGESLVIIERGRVEIIATVGDASQTLAMLGPGEVLGEMALLDPGPRSANARARDRVTGYAIDFRAFDALRLNMSPAAFKVLRALTLTVCSRLRSINLGISQAMAGEEVVIAQAANPKLILGRGTDTGTEEAPAAARPRPRRTFRDWVNGLLGRN